MISRDRSYSAADVAFCFLMGTHFALLQFGYFFLLEAFVSSQAVSFFVALFFWLVGFLAGLNLRGLGHCGRLLAAGVAAYYAAALLIHLFPFNELLLPLDGACIAVSGLLPGYFFVYARDRFDKIKHLMFHENNGFILGILLSLLGSVFAGRLYLDVAPLAAGLPSAAFYLWQRHQSRG